MSTANILVVEDDPDIAELVRYNLVREGYHVKVVTDGARAVRQIGEELPSLVILDLMLPGMDGLEVCRHLKRTDRTRGIPVLMVTAKSAEADVVLGLELGADDYVTKPFSPRVLVSRVRSVLRRRYAEAEDEGEAVVRKDLRIDPARHAVYVKGKPVDLTATEFGVLHLLARSPGRVYTREQIVDQVKGRDYAVTERAVDVQLVGLRKKLGPCAASIETVRGVGYRFAE